MAMNGADAMLQILEAGKDLGFEMVPGYSTHWSMGAEALIKLGFAGRAENWFERFCRTHRHYPMPESRKPITADDEQEWKSALSDFDRVGDWLALFEREIQEHDWQGAIAIWWPRLLPGLSAGLTHGLIRTAHAMRSIADHDGEPTAAHRRELALGLAYWAGKYAALPDQADLLGNDHLPELLLRIPRLDPEAKYSILQKGSFVHMGDIAGWADAVARLAPSGDVQSELSRLTASFAQVNLAHGDKFPIPLIHTVTAPAAVRMILPHLPDALHLVSFVAVWRTCAALLATFAYDVRETESTIMPSSPTLSKQALAERAADHGDEHAIKLTEACLREHAINPDDRYLFLAETMLGKLPRLRGAVT